MAFSKEFKQALVELPEKEKDKLILRLLRKDKVLAARLEFELLGMESAEDLRNALEQRIRDAVAGFSARNWSIGYLTLAMRSISGEITNHVKITKDKAGEIVLNLVMLNEILERNARKLESSTSVKARRVRIYMIARAFKILVLIKAMHEDYQLDFNEDLEKLGNHIASGNSLKKTAMNHGLDLDWLIAGEIPEDIKEQQAELRKQGFLK